MVTVPVAADKPVPMALPVITLVLTMAATLVSARFWLMVAARAIALAAAEPAGDFPLSLAA